VLPITNVAEEEGTFTNLRGRVQRFLQAKAAPGLARPSWYALADLNAALGVKAEYFLPSAVFEAMAQQEPAFGGLSYETLGLYGAPVKGAAATVGAA
jgi:NADH-quinone oxidoreductase subunit G